MGDDTTREPEDQLRDAILTLISQSEKLDDYLISQVENLSRSRYSFFSRAMQHVAHIHMDEEEARVHWVEIITELYELQEKADQTFPLKVAVLNHFLRKNAATDKAGERIIVDLHLFRHKERVSLLDELTGMFNRRYFEIVLKKELKRADRYRKIFSLVLFGIDGLDQLDPDKDAILIAKLIKTFTAQSTDMIRGEDTLCRFDRNEFFFILPETAGHGAQTFAQRLQHDLAEHPLFKQRRATVSAAIASYPVDGQDAEELVTFARSGLAQAQLEGSNIIKSKSGKELRKSRRFFMTWKVQYQVIEGEGEGDHNEYESRSEDVSLSGMSLETNREMEKGTKLLLVLRPSMMPDEVLKVIGIIRRVKRISLVRYNYGVQFEELSKDQRNHLRRILPTHEVRMT